jgi:hypothetical protein
MQDEEFYLPLIKEIVGKQKTMLGDKVALGRARKAPLTINPDGEIEEFYGDGEQAVDILVQQYEEFAGKSVIDSNVQNVVKSKIDPDDYGKLPERIRPGFTPDDDNSGEGILSSIKAKLA